VSAGLAVIVRVQSQPLSMILVCMTTCGDGAGGHVWQPASASAAQIRILIESKRPTCVITLYNEETETISHYHIAQSSIVSVIEKLVSGSGASRFCFLAG
jgi:hypothetical protein